LPELLREAGKAAGVEMTLSGQDLDASDQKSFHEAGVPAVQFFAGPHLDYHRPTDTADKVDPRGLDKVAGAARAAVLLLANLPGPLAATLSASSRPAPAPAAGRKATIGIVPDFTFNGTGVRVGGTLPGGPAETAGMREGDVIIRAGSTPIVVLKDLSDLLRMKQPGEKLPVRFLRGGKEMQATVDVRER
jgi:aminopeptidase N